jgi:hypothetical protein
MIFLLTAVVLSPGGSTHLHKNNTRNNTNNSRTTQIQANAEEWGSCPVFASFTLAFALQLREKARKNISQGKKTISMQWVSERKSDSIPFLVMTKTK